jgi:formylglycine-generating enzyme required for sulfatase activity
LVVLVLSCGTESSGNNGVDEGGEEVPAPPAEVRLGMARVPAGSFGRGCIAEQVAEIEVFGSHIECKTIEEDFILLDVPYRELTLSEFWIDEYETTREEWVACADAGFCEVTSLFTQPRSDAVRYPASYITWHEADVYCKWRGKRLPTEAEWEKAARGTDNRIFPWGNESPACNTANILGFRYTDVDDPTAATECESRQQEPVDAHPLDRSPYGVIGMYGNVQEWTADWAGQTYYSQAPEQDPLGPSAGDTPTSKVNRIHRGAYYGSSGGYTFRRWWFDPNDANPRIGVRCASSLPPEDLQDPLAE